MNVDAWLSEFEVITADQLKLSAASGFVRFAKCHDVASNYLTVVETRRSESLVELVIIDFRTGCPQRPVYPIKPTERLAVRFISDDEMPFVYVLRSDFPDTPHQYLPVEDNPPVICIDDRPWTEARLTWTTIEFFNRILIWFERAARGELDDARQPLDPVMNLNRDSFIISHDDLAQADNIDLVCVMYASSKSIMLRVKHRDAVQKSEKGRLFPLSPFICRIESESMKRLRRTPANLGSLHDMLSARGVDLFKDMRKQFSDWLEQTPQPQSRIRTPLVIIVEMPIIAPDEEIKNGTDLRAFITTCLVGDIAVALGIADKAESGIENAASGYLKRIPSIEPNRDVVKGIEVLSAEVHYAYDRKLAAQLSGQAMPDERKVVIVGAGAIGSHIADCLSREGRFEWTIIDDDQLLPHNLARHIGRSGDVTASKAVLVTYAVLSKFESAESVAKKPIIANVMTDNEEINNALIEADLIIDATASVATGRYLSDYPSKARRVSAFFNPTGTVGVLLAEPKNRHLTLRDLEAQLFALTGREDKLAKLFAPPKDVVAYTGGCRAITNRMPESNVMALSGLIAHGIGMAVNQPKAVMKTWALNSSGAVNFTEQICEKLQCVQAGKWHICVDCGFIRRVLAMRDAKLPNETGGVITGVIDNFAKRIYLADAAPASIDNSKESPGGFTRGRDGVREYLDEVSENTSGQVGYVGEWHSHPPHASTRPSEIDRKQIDLLFNIFDTCNSPTLMLIAGDKDIRIILADQKPTQKKQPKSYIFKHKLVRKCRRCGSLSR